MDPTIVGALIAAVAAIVASLIGANRIKRKGKGKLEIADIISSLEEGNKCVLDFRVQNTGNADLVINRVSFQALNVQSAATFGALEFSKTYDLDISELGLGETLDAPVAQTLKPGEIDRFGIVLIAAKMGTGVFRRWTLEPTLHTNVGATAGRPLEVLLPYEVSDELFKEARKASLDETRELEEEKRQIRESLEAGTLSETTAEGALREIESREREKRRFGS